ncbi:MAG: NADH-quinone oxidoreductase subunit NuoG [Candidatus Omnitrophica bacterium]|nr:NADH-quinone oxidoreductase subunit NuoG [Candidatus Omnitrophota bacterium]
MGNAITLTIDGREVTVQEGTMVIEAAKKLGIEIPYYCYHPLLKSVGCCRVCLVEVEGIPKLQTSCTLEVKNGMVVRTNTPLVQKRRKGVIGFLLANHPLDCPVCDQGGECDLQNFSHRYGPAVAKFKEHKRTFQKYYIGPLVEREMNRCILCKRCVRFYDEYGGETTLGEFNRAAETDIRTFYKTEFNPGFSGNTIFLCPVGALTDKVYRFKARVWDMKFITSVCPGCGTGCSIRLWSRNNRILRITPDRNNNCSNNSNHGILNNFLCDRGQFDFEYLSSGERVRTPMIKQNDGFIPVTYEKAMDMIVFRLKKSIAESGPDSVGGIISSASTCEEIYLFKKLFKDCIGSPNVDFRSRFSDSGQVNAILDESAEYSDLPGSGGVFVLGTNILHQQPVLGLYLRNRAKRKGSTLLLAEPYKTGMEDCASLSVCYRPGTEAYLLYGLILCMLNPENREDLSRIEGFEEFRNSFKEITMEAVEQTTGVTKETMEKVSSLLLDKEGWTIIIDGEKESLLFSAHNLGMALNNVQKGRVKSKVLPVFSQPNHRGAMKLMPESCNARKIIDAALSGKLKFLYLLGSDPVSEFLDRKKMGAVLKNVEFIVAQDVFLTEAAQYASIVLPGKAPHAKQGSFICSGGLTRELQEGIKEGMESEWKTITRLAERLGYSMRYDIIDDLRNEMLSVLQKKDSCREKFLPVRIFEKPGKFPFVLVEGKNMFARDKFISRCGAIKFFFKPGVCISPSDAEKSGLMDGDAVTVFNNLGELKVMVSTMKDVQPGYAVMTDDIACPLNILKDSEEGFVEVDIRKE